jgi:hypothetical protein
LLRPVPDTIKVETITITKEIERKKEWYEETWFEIGSYVVAILGTVYIMKAK